MQISCLLSSSSISRVPSSVPLSRNGSGHLDNQHSAHKTTQTCMLSREIVRDDGFAFFGKSLAQSEIQPVKAR
eukprot:g6654.t1